MKKQHHHKFFDLDQFDDASKSKKNDFKEDLIAIIALASTLIIAAFAITLLHK